LGAYGDAGAVLTGDEDLARRVRSLRSHGHEAKYEARFVGGNFRLDELQAAVLRVKLGHLRRWIEQRRENARALRSALSARAPELALPTERPGELHAFHQFVIRTPRRDALRAHLLAAGVESEIYYPRPMHRQQAWRDPAELPAADCACEEALALPVHPHLSPSQIAAVASACESFFRGKG
jgi:dTDP-4-amino-4,6-dideoxygalactose transaminase